MQAQNCVQAVVINIAKRPVNCCVNLEFAISWDVGSTTAEYFAHLHDNIIREFNQRTKYMFSIIIFVHGTAKRCTARLRRLRLRICTLYGLYYTRSEILHILLLITAAMVLECALVTVLRYNNTSFRIFMRGRINQFRSNIITNMLIRGIKSKLWIT